MAVQDALSVKLEEVRRQESLRQQAKIAALREAFSAEDVSLDRISGFEVAILDRQYVLLELAPESEGLKASISGPGQREYVPGVRWLMGVRPRKSGEPELVAYTVQDLEDMAHLALLKGAEFDAMTASLEMVVALDGDTLWRNIQNR